MPEEHRRGLLPTLGASVLLAAAFLLAPPMGTDLAAQQARAEFFTRYGWTPVDLGWYGGVAQFGYSLVTAPLGSVVGMRVLGAVAGVVASVAFGWLLWRTGVRRPVLGGTLGALAFAANLASGRITFAVGLALALVALCVAASSFLPTSVPPASASPAPTPASLAPVRSGLGGSAQGGAHPGWARRGRIAGVFLLGALATWASPVAGLFAGLAGAALLLTGPVRAHLRTWRPDSHWPPALALCLGPALALAPMALLFGNGGRQPFTAESMRIHVALAVLVVLVAPARHLAVRIAGALTVVLLLGAFYLPSPIGSNALRLPMLFTIPVLAAVAELGRARLALLLAAVFWWQPFVVTSDPARAGSPESRAAFYEPLVGELRGRAPGRIEVVPLRDHWESVYVAAQTPLARGWERQVDTDRNALFYADGLTAADYVAWLRANAVSYVAIAPESVPDRYARTEAAPVRQGLPELRPVWRNDTWRLYQVTQPQPLVSAPAELVRSDRAGVSLRAPVRADVLVRVRWSRWLSLDRAGACLAAGPDGWTEVRVTTPGDYRLTSSLRPGPGC